MRSRIGYRVNIESASEKGVNVSDDNEVVELLKANLEAQNRTTHAVRAFVRFLFIQLVAVTIAAPLTYVGIAFEFMYPTLFVAFIVLVVGIIWSSTAGWNELGLSDRFRESRAKDRVARAQSAESERQAREKVRDAQKQQRAEDRKKLFASRRFRVGASILIPVGFVLLGAGIVIPQLLEQASIEADAQRLQALPETYDAAVQKCEASMVGVTEVDVDSVRTQDGTALQLTVDYIFEDIGRDGFVNCVSEELTGAGSAGLTSGGLGRVQGDFSLRRTSTTSSQSLLFTPTAAAD